MVDIILHINNVILGFKFHDVFLKNIQVKGSKCRWKSLVLKILSFGNTCSHLTCAYGSISKYLNSTDNVLNEPEVAVS